MRIIAGEFRSRTILAPKGTDTRPTLDRTRESLFNILAALCPGARVLDLYAGSGALALEALSRGAESAVLCDCAREAARVIRQNIDALRVAERARLLQMADMQAIALLSHEKARFDLVFLDPPYRLDTVPACAALADAGVLEEGALVVIEHAAATIPAPDGRFRLTDRRKYRDTMISFYRFETILP
ncbi:MAG: 16S rRNA (guanine(966)-N(2))-methyltransferase RsmD [Clostridia bacterium]|nr:16S rRNA (guanine(966)-N(2))-methyltransferase RsmD [Clostridia bacterium]